MFLFLPVLPLPLSLFLPLPKGPEELEPGQPHSLLQPKLVCAFVRGSGPGQRSQALGLRGGPRPQEQRSLASFLPGVCGAAGALLPLPSAPLKLQVPNPASCVPLHLPNAHPLLPGSGGAMLASTNSGSSWPGKCWPPAPLVPHLGTRGCSAWGRGQCPLQPPSHTSSRAAAPSSAPEPTAGGLGCRPGRRRLQAQSGPLILCGSSASMARMRGFPLPTAPSHSGMKGTLGTPE